MWLALRSGRSREAGFLMVAYRGKKRGRPCDLVHVENQRYLGVTYRRGKAWSALRSSQSREAALTTYDRLVGPSYEGFS